MNTHELHLKYKEIFGEEQLNQMFKDFRIQYWKIFSQQYPKMSWPELLEIVKTEFYKDLEEEYKKILF